MLIVTESVRTPDFFVTLIRFNTARSINSVH